MGRMMAAGAQWEIHENAREPVLLALCLRQLIGVRAPAQLPHLRGIPARQNDRSERTQAALESQWEQYWAMTVEPRAHTSPVPLTLVDGFRTMIALPEHDFDELREAITPSAEESLALARAMHAEYTARSTAHSESSYRAYAAAIAEHERQVGRRAHSFELNVEVLPLTQRGLWWIGALTVAVTDGLRQDIAAFDAAIHPIIDELS